MAFLLPPRDNPLREHIDVKFLAGLTDPKFRQAVIPGRAEAFQRAQECFERDGPITVGLTMYFQEDGNLHLGNFLPEFETAEDIEVLWIFGPLPK